MILPGEGNTEAGKLIYLMGASGSGKDSLLRAVAGWQKDSGSIVAARRYITRNVRPGCEPHSSLSEAEFDASERAGEFLFNWEAHGFQYGIGQEVLAELNVGKHVVVNGSRRYLATAQGIYPDLLPLCLEVASEVLESRLIARGRETAGEVTARLQQAQAFSGLIPDDVIRIDNNDRIELAAEQLRQLLKS
jgi:ribose 1,5-bisphosphokinase